MIEFFMAMKTPTMTHQQKKVNFKTKQFYESEDLKAVRSLFIAHLSRHIPDEKLNGPIRITTKWLYELKGKHSDGEYKTTKPDVDNMVKLLHDCMTKCGFWKDDSEISSMIVEKFWSSVPGIYVKIEEL